MNNLVERVKLMVGLVTEMETKAKELGLKREELLGAYVGSVLRVGLEVIPEEGMDKFLDSVRDLSSCTGEIFDNPGARDGNQKAKDQEEGSPEK